MKALAVEEYTPKDQADSDNPAKFRIKPLTSLQLTEIMQDGIKNVDDGIKLSFSGVLLCLKYGLEDPSKINSMPSRYHAELSYAIWKKALLSEDERKN